MEQRNRNYVAKRDHENHQKLVKEQAENKKEAKIFQKEVDRIAKAFWDGEPTCRCQLGFQEKEKLIQALATQGIFEDYYYIWFSKFFEIRFRSPEEIKEDEQDESYSDYSSEYSYESSYD